MITENAQIIKTFLGVEDHGIMTWMLTVDYGSSQQGAGGYALDEYKEAEKKRIGGWYGTQSIKEILSVLECASWEEINGAYVRIRRQEQYNSPIEQIGHITKDKWFNFKKFFAEAQK